ncbi:uncharacterized protein [Zea mays]|uniref:uncharacterized protein n=1 Tax=Zea mays TaxID=4577 RepID=UPI0009AAADA8|nr:uncharacterized protein LOC109941220 [Zea mays]|eukprot:XP_020397345.1 uncharacterized protein LOC109941220 [Zea mays]
MADPTNTPSDGDPPQHRKTGVAAAAKNIVMPNVDDDDDFEPPKKKCNISMDAPNKTQKLDPRDMTLRIGPDKELKITKQTVHQILGLPNLGGGKPLNINEANAAATLRASLNISKDEFVISKLQDRLRLGQDDDLSIRCFFLILFNRLLFPTASWSISFNEVVLIEEMERFPQIDWCHLIFSDLCEAAQRWHNRSINNVSATIYGCSIIVLLYYLDHLHHAAAPNNKNGTPRIKYFNKNIIRALSMADKRKPRQGGEPFGVCPFRSSSETCYVSKSPTTCQIEFPMRPETFDEDPNQHDRLPNIIIQLPLMQDLMANKIQMLPAHQRQKFQATLIDYDLEVGKIFVSIKQCLNTIGTKQSNLAPTFGELIDEVLRADKSVTPNIQGQTVVGGTVENDSGPVFDKTPIGSVSAPEI